MNSWTEETIICNTNFDFHLHIKPKIILKYFKWFTGINDQVSLFVYILYLFCNDTLFVILV